jgi:uncharacterized protein (TIGR02594 family)
MKQKWLEVAEKEVGQHEVKGGENPRIIEYHDTCTLHAKEDEIPWCSAFVNWCMKQAGIVGTGSAAAKSWLGWGVPLEIPSLGCVCVVRDVRQPEGAGYHVALWQGESEGRLILLGGNQSDSVKVSSFGLATFQVQGYRIPS